MLTVLLLACPAPPEPGDDPTSAADDDGDGYVVGPDCDDLDPHVHPGAAEHCDGADEDCDGVADDLAVDAIRAFVDADGDGYGDPDQEVVGCSVAGLSGNDGDCDDGDASINPGAGDLCDGTDRDCGAGSRSVAQIGERGFRSIAEAVEAAAGGELVEICDGTFDEGGVTVGVDLTVASWSGDRDAVVLDGTGLGSVFLVDGGALTLRSITVVGGEGSDVEGTLYGGAVNALGGAGGPVTLDDCVLADASGGPSTIGGAVAGRDVTVVGGAFTGNRAAGGGAVYLGVGGAMTATGTTFTGNQATASGGAIYSLAEGTAALVLDGCTFRGNAADTGGAISADGLTLIDTAIVENGARSDAGGVFALPIVIVGGSFERNVADTDGNGAGGGGGLWTGDGGTITGTTFLDNRGHYGGGALANGGLDLQDVTFRGNLAEGVAGGLYVDAGAFTADAATLFEENESLYEDGGGLVISAFLADVTWTGGTFFSNFGGRASYGRGGGIFAIAGPAAVTISNVVVEDNRSDFGAGVYLLSTPITLEDSVLVGNTAYAGGGVGVEADAGAETLLERVEIRASSASSGGGVDVVAGRAHVVDCVVEENSASQAGGGVMVRDGASLVVDTSDLGEGATDNAPDDVFAGGSSAQYGADVSFRCDASGCVDL